MSRVSRAHYDNIHRESATQNRHLSWIGFQQSLRKSTNIFISVSKKRERNCPKHKGIHVVAIEFDTESNSCICTACSFENFSCESPRRWFLVCQKCCPECTQGNVRRMLAFLLRKTFRLVYTENPTQFSLAMAAAAIWFLALAAREYWIILNPSVHWRT